MFCLPTDSSPASIQFTRNIKTWFHKAWAQFENFRWCLLVAALTIFPPFTANVVSFVICWCILVAYIVINMQPDLKALLEVV